MTFKKSIKCMQTLIWFRDLRVCVIMLRPEGQLTVTVTFQTFLRFARIVLDKYVT